eukprot:CAMPEP_0118854398 /NCGR_PEP_ID=MMETSP1163-20130328/2602_1 /TAXON_ID=124430 /ORGANISM="Phaeomonas parva, Strain CCMP2877" /LENGTH=416 /DNA_ID=CAMNT_0006787113 /DNA_START=213 /DNA_END=1463 /DNA_ORIENTATION=+
MASATSSSSSSSSSSEAVAFAPLRDSPESKLFVNIMEARNLKASDVGGSSDPFVVVKVGDKMLQTSVQRRSLNPVWNETFIIPGASLAELYQQTLEISVRDKDYGLTGKVTGDEVLGTLKVPLSRIAIGEEIDLWFELEGPEAAGRPRGQLHMVLQLEGPFRTEFKVLEKLGYFVAGVTDKVINTTGGAASAATPYAVNKYTIVALVPIVVGVVAAAPLLTVAFTVGLPLLLPFIIIGVLVIAMVTIIASALALSSKPSRTRAMKMVSPLLNRLRDTPVGQQILYQTGPRPGLESMLDTFVPPDQKYNRLYMSITIDIIGGSSYLLPLIGEVGDLAWAPMQALLVNAMFRRSSKYAAYFSFAEEILPFTDIIPTATLAWLRMYGPEVYDELKAKLVERRQARIAQNASPEITSAAS